MDVVSPANVERGCPSFLQSAMSRHAILSILTTATCAATLLAAGVLQAGESPAIRDARNRMVDKEIVAAGVKDPRVIRSMRDTPRHEFVPTAQRRWATMAAITSPPAPNIRPTVMTGISARGSPGYSR